MAKKQYKYSAEFRVPGPQKKSWPLSVTIARAQSKAKESELIELGNLVVGAQLEMKAVIQGGDAEGQQLMGHADTIEPLEQIVTCASLSRITEDHISFRLSLPVDVDPVQMRRFAFASGSIALKRIGDRPKDAPVAADAEEEGSED